jgi:branched-chain amino acid aminotransferase
VEICVFAFPFISRNEKVRNGVKLGVSAWRKIPGDALPARVKTCGNYVNSRLARSQMKTAGFDDALMLTKGGTVSESTGSNLFIVKNGELVTPDVTSDILEGITRNSIIEFAQADLGLTVHERKVARSELFSCDEAFLCGTVAEIIPINSIDHIDLGNGKPGKITRKLQDHFFRIVRGENPKYQNWLTPVYGKE